jgi:peptidoglycan/LPS O-acetylase OafA/YrhL
MTVTAQLEHLGRFALLPPGMFRLALAAVVVVSHLSRFDVGRSAVLLFFLLSGYWVAKLWEQDQAPGATWRFYLSRYLRIMPVYLLVMIAAALLRGYPLSVAPFVLLGIASNSEDPTGVAWSLDIELQFYLLVPLLAINWRTSLLASLPLSVLAWIPHALPVPPPAAGEIVTVFQYLPLFALGALAANERWAPSSKLSRAGVVLFGLLTLITISFTPFADKLQPDPFHRDLWAAIWIMPLVPYVLRSLQIRSSSVDRHLGNLSYPLYLVHYPIIALLVPFGANDVTMAAVSALAALLLYVLADRPIDRWRSRLARRGR